ILPAEVLVLLEEFGAGRATLVLGFDGGLDLLGMVVDRLPAAAGGLGLVRDVSMSAGQACGGVGDPGDEGYLEHGGGPPWVRVRRTTPPIGSTPSNDQDDLAWCCKVSTRKRRIWAELGRCPVRSRQVTSNAVIPRGLRYGAV